MTKINFKLIVAICSLLVWVPAQAYERETGLKPAKARPKWARPTSTIQGLDWDLKVRNGFYDYYMIAFNEKKIVVDSKKDARFVKQLNAIMKKLKPHSLLGSLPYEVHLVDDPFVNATCMPGGGILFFKGIFDNNKGLINENDEEEIAAVMAHEMAHASLRHAYKRSQNAASAVVVGTVFAAGLGSTLGDSVVRLFNLAYYPALGLYLFKYTRENEAQADLEGMYMLMKAGYNPEKMITVWERAAKRSDEKDKHGVWDTHPSSRERASALAKHLKEIRKNEKEGL